MMYKSLMMAVLILIQMSCASYTKEEIDYVVRDLIGECYKVNVDSFLYSLNRCSSADVCYGIQAYTDKDKSIKYKSRPYSHEQVISDLDFWNDVINRYPGLPGIGKGEYIGTVPAGTKFEFVDIDYRNMPGYREYWAAEVVLKGGEFKEHHVKIPDLSYKQIFPPWTVASPFVNGPVWNKKYLTKCML
ncbi:hypothetical protein FM037_24690 [Shewanella psychropiezotolerans]|uniref:Lipoprotein n=1 Tax=Shewanella psychropiezotolerans TaxID=2593655 RepID=A0ABX5X3G7_9GAMM|nr:hypothetical protein [Shewanella psychropiezotolerans]QDO85871.1 hypothetical protein FM037_24690 [Shewanella psychropiezotolerans]